MSGAEAPAGKAGGAGPAAASAAEPQRTPTLPWWFAWAAVSCALLAIMLWLALKVGGVLLAFGAGLAFLESPHNVERWLLGLRLMHQVTLGWLAAGIAATLVAYLLALPAYVSGRFPRRSLRWLTALLASGFVLWALLILSLARWQAAVDAACLRPWAATPGSLFASCPPVAEPAVPERAPRR